MADEIDVTNDRIQAEEELFVNEVCRQAKLVPIGKAGECFYCGEFFKRVVEVVDEDSECTVSSCGRCRDRRGLK